MQNVRNDTAGLASQRDGVDTVNVVIIDDHPAIREALADVIEREEGIRLCGEAGTAHEAKRVIARTTPQVVVVDISLERSNGLDLVRELRKDASGLGIVVFSMHDETVYAERALQVGASGYVMKTSPIGDVIEAIRCAAHGKRYLSHRMAGRVDGAGE